MKDLTEEKHEFPYCNDGFGSEIVCHSYYRYIRLFHRNKEQFILKRHVVQCDVLWGIYVIIHGNP